jgi:hypothetical protein
MAREERGEEATCDITGCQNRAERSLPASKLKKTNLDFDSSLKRVHLCKEHYRVYKKETRLERKLETMGR